MIASNIRDTARSGLSALAWVDGRVLKFVRFGYSAVTYELSDAQCSSTSYPLSSTALCEFITCCTTVVEDDLDDLDDLDDVFYGMLESSEVSARPGWYYCEDMHRFPDLYSEDPLVRGSVCVGTDGGLGAWADMPHPLKIRRLIALADLAQANLVFAWTYYIPEGE